MNDIDKFPVRVCGIDVTGYKRQGEPWQDAAARAIRRALKGRGIATSWRLEAHEKHGAHAMRYHVRATIVGTASSGGSSPILGEAQAILSDETFERG